MWHTKNKKYAFTLVELIIVITILAILATIAFISFKNYTQSTRDTNRMSSLKNMEKGLDIFALKTGKYPNPEGEIIEVMGSGNTLLFKKGSLQEIIATQIQADKAPQDPLTQGYYTYATTENNQQWQISTSLEDDLLGYQNIIVPQVHAQGNYRAYVIGNYQPKLFVTSDTSYFIPSLIFNYSGSIVDNTIEINALNSQNIYYVVNKDKNLPYSVNGNTQINNTPTDKLLNIQDIVNTLGEEKKETAQNLIEELTKGKLNTEITPENKVLIETFISSPNQNSSSNNSSNPPPVVNSCATQPNYTGATFTLGNASEPDQAWQSTDGNSACYWTCGSGKVLDEGACVASTCAGEQPDGVFKVSNADSFAGGTWHYSETGGKCTYSCGSGYSYVGGTCQDTTPPVGGNFTINSGATTTSSMTVTLNITCPTDTSNPIQVAYGNTPNPTNWVSCNTSFFHTLTSEAGSKNVYVRFRDSATTPNMTADITKSITFTPPTLVGILVSLGVYGGTNNITLNWPYAHNSSVVKGCDANGSCSGNMTFSSSQAISGGYRVLYTFSSPSSIKQVSIREWGSGTHNYRPSFAYYYSDDTVAYISATCGTGYGINYGSWDVSYSCSWQ